MNMFSLRTIIDDIMLIVRNNNISESEDLSRDQIAAWVLHYKAQLTKQAIEKDKASGDDERSTLSMYERSYGPLELEEVESLDGTPLFTRKTKDPIPNLLDKDKYYINTVYDQEGNPMQYMSQQRRFFQYRRKYTGAELTYRYENEEDGGHIYVQGMSDGMNIKYIYIDGIFEDQYNDDKDEDEITIPDWMVPDIKKAIFTYELPLMLRLPSDDNNNSTLSDIKPKGPQQTSRSQNER